MSFLKELIVCVEEGGREKYLCLRDKNVCNSVCLYLVCVCVCEGHGDFAGV